MNDIREDLKAYLDGELAEDRAREVESALAADPTLREEADLMKAMSETLKVMASEPTVAGAEETLARVRRRRRWNIGQLATIGGSICLALIAIGIVRMGGGAGDTASMTRSVSFESADAPAPASEAPGRELAASNMPAEVGAGADKAKGGEFRVSNGSPNIPAGSGAVDDMIAVNPILIKTATLGLKVESAKDALVAAEQIAKSQGGYTTDTNHVLQERVTPSSTATLRVPVKNFEATLTALRALGEVTQDQSNSTDVTTEVADVEARIKVMRAEEESYVTMLRAARRVGELLEIKERLSSVRQQIESLDAQRKSLRGQASYSTIHATFTERPKAGEPKEENWSGDAWTNAVNGLLGVLRNLGQAAIFAFVYAPIWLPIVFVGWLVARRMR